ncbi:hypothetical protein H5410_051062 [Solanum commersonii]|uniref:Uncharacterized protein n=1 Tax=Solanum commersonii TaxID=4109 RepID=A0A9J5WXA9_SOLCO|nr:hypothetical protein H5410_051062 [Solanum commersonii]
MLTLKPFSDDQRLSVVHPQRGSDQLISLRLTNSFHLSLTVLVRYWSLAHIFPQIEFSPVFCLRQNSRPIYAAFPNKKTCRRCLLVRQSSRTMGISPSLAPPSRGLGFGLPPRTLFKTTISMREQPNSKAGLFPVHSLLLRKSLQAATHSRCRSSSSSLPTSIGSILGPTCPALKANPFPKVIDPFKRIPFPTSSSDKRLFTLETLCDYEYDRALMTLIPPDFEGPPGAHRILFYLRYSLSRWTLPLAEPIPGRVGY